MDHEYTSKCGPEPKPRTLTPTVPISTRMKYEDALELKQLAAATHRSQNGFFRDAIYREMDRVRRDLEKRGVK